MALEERRASHCVEVHTTHFSPVQSATRAWLCRLAIQLPCHACILNLKCQFLSTRGSLICALAPEFNPVSDGMLGVR